MTTFNCRLTADQRAYLSVRQCRIEDMHDGTFNVSFWESDNNALDDFEEWAEEQDIEYKLV